jgi:hypothetical protein
MAKHNFSFIYVVVMVSSSCNVVIPKLSSQGVSKIHLSLVIFHY